jgi:P-aminobenzoate N-oxygenase AurF.
VGRARGGSGPVLLGVRLRTAATADLYQRGKDKQWDATKRIDWEQPVNPLRVMETGEELVPIYGSRQWEKLNQAERDELSRHLSSWLFSQFLHGEQGALTVAARIVESVPDMDSKFYAATQVMDEAGTSSCSTGSSRRRSACSTRSTTTWRQAARRRAE